MVVSAIDFHYLGRLLQQIPPTLRWGAARPGPGGAGRAGGGAGAGAVVGSRAVEGGGQGAGGGVV